jgi:hypothetical protein
MRRRTPRAARWADTLFDLAVLHANARLEEIATQVDEDFVRRGVELTPEGEGHLLSEAAAALR